MTTYIHTSISLQDTATLGKKLAADLKAGDAVCLYGNLGAGKTTLARYIINALLLHETSVTSPTFNIVHQYTSKCEQTISHFDLYRIKTIGELAEIGFSEALNEHISIVEWPEIADEYISQYATRVIKVFLDRPLTV